MYTDKTINCIDCGAPFIFSANEQEFYAQKGFSNEPKRCKNCRDKRKSGGLGDGGSRTLYNVTCDACGKPAQVPFNPTNGKPVYCRDCYRDRRPATGR
jgi:CxxC-x17-CxxC domain-containing protein